MKLWKIACLAALTIFTFGCEEDFTFEPQLDDEAPSTVIDEPTASGLSAEYQLLLDQVNELRASGCRCGNTNMPAVASLVWSDQLAQAALRHSTDMNNSGVLDHNGTDGSNPGVRISATGYAWQTYGENIAWGYNDAAAVFNGWLNSPGHCRNLMNAGFKEMGAARVGSFYTQDFGAKR